MVMKGVLGSCMSSERGVSFCVNLDDVLSVFSWSLLLIGCSCEFGCTFRISVFFVMGVFVIVDFEEYVGW